MPGRASARLVLLLAALALALWSAPAHAAAPSALVVFGKADAKDQALVLSVVDRVLRQAGWPLVPPLTENDAMIVRGCLAKEAAWPCVEPMASKKGIERIVAVRVELVKSSDGTSQIVLTGHLVYAGSSSVLSQARYCGACSAEELTVYSEEIAKLLMDERAVQAGTTKVSVASTPLGAEVRIDGKVVGITNNVFATFPGRHTIDISRTGYLPQTRTVTALDGKTVEASVTLIAAGGPAPAEPSAPEQGGSAARRYAPLAVIGVGAAVMIAGGVLWRKDENQRTVPDLQTDPTYFDSAPAGIAMLAGGALLSGLGGYWWWTSRPSHHATPTVATTSSSVVLGILGSF